MSDVRHSDAKSPSVGDFLHRTCQRSDALFETLSGDARMTPRQLTVLTAIAKDEQSSQTSLTKATNIDRSTMADIVRRLVKRGLVTRKRTKHDARAYHVTLTAAGRLSIAKAEPIREMADNTLLDVLSKQDRLTLIRLLEKISADPPTKIDQSLEPRHSQREA